MDYLSVALLVCGLVTIFPTSTSAEVLWSGLKATIDSNTSNPYLFNTLPRTVSDATNAGWTQDTSQGSCDGGTPYFAGNRYLLNDDPAAMLLFDTNGYIAGYQVGLAKSFGDYSTSTYAAMYIDDGDMYVVTVYFTNPADICSTGRTAQQFTDQGTGSMLYIQTGASSSDVMSVPRDSETLLADTDYNEGLCVTYMGKHYWYALDSDTSCDDIFPVALLYTGGTMTAFAFSFIPAYNTSDRWEHPLSATFGAFVQSVPTCLIGDGMTEVTTLHIFLTMDPTQNICPAPPTTAATTPSSAPLRVGAAPTLSVLSILLAITKLGV